MKFDVKLLMLYIIVSRCVSQCACDVHLYARMCLRVGVCVHACTCVCVRVCVCPCGFKRLYVDLVLLPQHNCYYKKMKI